MKDVIVTYKLDCFLADGEKEEFVFTNLDAANEYADQCMENNIYERIDVVKEMVCSRMIYRMDKS